MTQKRPSGDWCRPDPGRAASGTVGGPFLRLTSLPVGGVCSQWSRRTRAGATERMFLSFCDETRGGGAAWLP